MVKGSPESVFMDHIAIAVIDIDGASRAWERMGFTLRGFRPSSAFGVTGGSELIAFPSNRPGVQNFIELAYVDRVDAHPHVDKLYGGQVGVRALIMSTTNADATRMRWLALGLGYEPVREVMLSSVGAHATRHMKLLTPEIDDFPIYFGGIQWSPTPADNPTRHLNHPNGVRRWTGTIYHTDADPCPIADRLAAAWAVDIELRTPRECTIKTGDTFLTMRKVLPASPNELVRRSVPQNVESVWCDTITVEADNLDSLGRYLSAQAVSYERIDGQIVVRDVPHCNVTLIFRV